MHTAVWIVGTALLLAGLALGFYFLITTSINSNKTNVLVNNNTTGDGIQLTIAPLVSTVDVRATFPNGDFQGAPILIENDSLEGSETKDTNIVSDSAANLNNYLAQYIQYDIPGAEHIWYHDQGFMAVQLGQGIQFYHIDASGKWIPDNIVYLPLFVDSSSDYTHGTKIVAGCFAPALGLSNETYYFAVSYGVSVRLNPSSTCATGCAHRVRLYSCKAPTLSNTSSFQWNVISEEIKHPFYDGQWDVTQPWMGAFGQRIQFVLDNTGIALKHCLYIASTQHSASQPGGSIFMYIFRDNDATHPSIYLHQMIKDFQLVRNRSNVSLTGVSATFPDPITILCSFGCADFYVYTPIQDPDGYNFLLVGNASTEDPSSNNIFKQGYVQGYVLDKTSGRWVQGGSNVQLTSADDKFPFRLCAAQANGFGMTVQYVPSRHVILVGDSTDNMPNTLVRLFAYQLTSSASDVSEATVTESLAPLTIVTVLPDSTDEVKGYTFNVYPSNLSVAQIFRTSVTSMYDSGNSTVLLISGATSSFNYARALITLSITSECKTRVLSKYYLNTYQVNLTPTLTYSTEGYAQSIFVGYSRSHQTRFITFNNPYQTQTGGPTNISRAAPEVICLVSRVP